MLGQGNKELPEAPEGRLESTVDIARTLATHYKFSWINEICYHNLMYSKD